MRTFSYALYDAFSKIPFGGSQADVVLGASEIVAYMRLQIAKQLALPATYFVSAYSSNSVTARFESTKRKYPMCGHDTFCLMTICLKSGD